MRVRGLFLDEAARGGSDPRGVNLAVNAANPLATNITTKKLWVAAIDLSQAPGVDSSHPAFYLPGQELIAGNSRGFQTS